eukprot:TRINITY_DN2464_c4_g1_i1.p1 TRINITY_DN2464_c4_g1~~TRINITY_DN2464_c4_g1_i1.p1  ORF type:complete len:635 (-),score=139.84 TRINITY_DN2464_c4_g1_i1:152-2056(-)
MAHGIVARRQWSLTVVALLACGLALSAATASAAAAAAEDGAEGSDETCSADDPSPHCAAGRAATPAAEEAAALSRPAVTVAPPRPASQSAAPRATADLITQEVEELEQYIKLCDERVAMLQELQGILETGVNISLPDAHARLLREKLPLLADVVEEREVAPDGASEDYLVRSGDLVLSDSASFVRLLQLKSSATSPSGATTASGQGSVPSSIIVAVQTNGGVKMFTNTGNLELSFDAGHDRPVTAAAVPSGGIAEERLLATGDASGLVRVHRIQVRAAKRAPRDNSSSLETERVSQYLSPQLNVTAQFHVQIDDAVGSADGGDGVKLTALAFTSSKALVVGDSAGTVRIFSRNGTLKFTVDALTTPGEGIVGFAVPASGSSLLFWGGSEWGYLDTDKGEARRIECQGFESAIHDAVLDSQQSSRVIVASEDGAVSVLNVKNRKDCRVEHRFHKGSLGGSNAQLASIDGFALGLYRGDAQRTGAVTALNMSVVGKKRNPLSQTSPVVWRSHGEKWRDWSVLRRSQQPDVIALLGEDGQRIHVMELIMTAYRPPVQEDPMWFSKVPMALICIVLVAGYQYMKHKNKGGKKGGKDFDWDSSEFKNLRSRAAAKRVAKAKSEAPGSEGGASSGLGSDM